MKGSTNSIGSGTSQFITLTSEVSGLTITQNGSYVKDGVAYINIELLWGGSGSIAGYTRLFTLPSNARPISAYLFTAAVSLTASIGNFPIQLHSTGAVQSPWSLSGTSCYYELNVSYPVN